jgi:hypothetical protein
MPLHAPGKGRRGKPDPQAKALYAWENAWASWGEESMSLEQCQLHADWACDLWKVPHVPVRMQTARKTYSAYDDGDRSIALLRHHMNPATVLHETAHHIVDVAYGTAFQDHGPAFVGVYADLLIERKLAPLKQS